MNKFCYSNGALFFFTFLAFHCAGIVLWSAFANPYLYLHVKNHFVIFLKHLHILYSIIWLLFCADKMVSCPWLWFCSVFWHEQFKLWCLLQMCTSFLLECEYQLRIILEFDVRSSSWNIKKMCSVGKMLTDQLSVKQLASGYWRTVLSLKTWIGRQCIIF